MNNNKLLEKLSYHLNEEIKYYFVPRAEEDEIDFIIKDGNKEINCSTCLNTDSDLDDIDKELMNVDIYMGEYSDIKNDPIKEEQMYLRDIIKKFKIPPNFEKQIRDKWEKVYKMGVEDHYIKLKPYLKVKLSDISTKIYQIFKNNKFIDSVMIAIDTPYMGYLPKYANIKPLLYNERSVNLAEIIKPSDPTPKDVFQIDRDKNLKNWNLSDYSIITHIAKDPSQDEDMSFDSLQTLGFYYHQLLKSTLKVNLEFNHKKVIDNLKRGCYANGMKIMTSDPRIIRNPNMGDINKLFKDPDCSKVFVVVGVKLNREGDIIIEDSVWFPISKNSKDPMEEGLTIADTLAVKGMSYLVLLISKNRLIIKTTGDIINSSISCEPFDRDSAKIAGAFLLDFVKKYNLSWGQPYRRWIENWYRGKNRIGQDIWVKPKEANLLDKLYKEDE